MEILSNSCDTFETSTLRATPTNYTNETDEKVPILEVLC
jgi:hypothetical protein